MINIYRKATHPEEFQRHKEQLAQKATELTLDKLAREEWLRDHRTQQLINELITKQVELLDSAVRVNSVDCLEEVRTLRKVQNLIENNNYDY